MPFPFPVASFITEELEEDEEGEGVANASEIEIACACGASVCASMLLHRSSVKVYFKCFIGKILS